MRYIMLALLFAAPAAAQRVTLDRIAHLPDDVAVVVDEAARPLCTNANQGARVFAEDEGTAWKCLAHPAGQKWAKLVQVVYASSLRPERWLRAVCADLGAEYLGQDDQGADVGELVAVGDVRSGRAYRALEGLYQPRRNPCEAELRRTFKVDRDADLDRRQLSGRKLLKAQADDPEDEGPPDADGAAQALAVLLGEGPDG